MSADGKHEITMATNYIGHCILNDELMDLLAKAGQDGDYARYDIYIIIFKAKLRNITQEGGPGQFESSIIFRTSNFDLW